MSTSTGDRLPEVYICTERSDACHRTATLTDDQLQNVRTLRAAPTTASAPIWVRTGYSTCIPGSTRIPVVLALIAALTLDAVLALIAVLTLEAVLALIAVLTLAAVLA